MPTVLRSGPYRVYFYSHEPNEPNEPPHVHVDRDGSTAKFWLHPLQMARSRGFLSGEFRRIDALLRARRGELLEAWNEHFGD